MQQNILTIETITSSKEQETKTIADCVRKLNYLILQRYLINVQNQFGSQNLFYQRQISYHNQYQRNSRNKIFITRIRKGSKLFQKKKFQNQLNFRQQQIIFLIILKRERKA
ncbi:unnamed protein product [Paramecium sonneborni]|uniref:Uncharacterized protein n=1 Tax=Paramecium sonneborni TaxID=65129 RepID=A0A8S1NRA5_9CILI|nr:unnamed protein product [Paramecium sonneborni]